MDIGVMIKEHLEKRGITQAHISRETGIETSKLNLALNGGRRLSLDEYATICGVLEVNTDFFLKPRLPDDKEVKN